MTHKFITADDLPRPRSTPRVAMNTYFIIHTQIIGARGGKITQKFVVLAESEEGAKGKAMAQAYEGSKTKELICTLVTDIKCVSVA